MASSFDRQLTAIVIGRFDLGEADRIITLFSREQGKVRATARGVRRITSKLAGHVELFSRVETWIHPGKTLDSITSARLLTSAVEWVHRPDRVSLAYVLAQLLDRASTEGEAQPELYDLGSELLDQLPGEADVRLLEFGLKLRFLSELGLRPVLDRCTVCDRSTFSGMTYGLDAERGGLVCNDCGVTGYPIDEKAIKLWRMALELPLAHLALIRDSKTIAGHSLELVDIFYEYHFGRRFTGMPLGV